MGTAPGKARIVEDGALGKGDGTVGVFQYVRWNHLREGLIGVEEACLRVGRETDARLAHFELN